MTVDLHGYRHSVYAWIARLTLREKGVDYRWHEVNPFAPDLPASYLDLHPFQRVPVLVNGDAIIYETAAITQFVDEAFDGPALQPAAPLARARMRQVIAIVDSYGYWPMVRQVFSHGVFRPAMGEAGDPAEVAAGLAASAPVLAALDRIAAAGGGLSAESPTLADLHLAPMLAYFGSLPAGREAIDACSTLAHWCEAMMERPSVIETWPPLPG